MADLNFFASSSFQLRRPGSAANGVTSPVDPLVSAQLDELAALLGKGVFYVKGGDQGGDSIIVGLSSDFVARYLALPLSPRFTPPRQGRSWEQDSLADWLSNADSRGMSLSEYIDTNAELSSLKYDFNNSLTENWSNLNYNISAVLNGYPAIVDYLVAYGNLVMGMTEIHGLANFIFSNRFGIANIINYATIGAARAYVHDQQINVPQINDNGHIADKVSVLYQISTASILLSSNSFQPVLAGIIDDFVFNADTYKLIDSLKLDLTATMRARLAPLIKASPITINAANAKILIPSLIINNMAALTASGSTVSADAAAGDADYAVDYLEDNSTSIQVSQSAVRCSAQLYYSMILGDELNVFDAMNYFTHKFLVRQAIQITDSQLRDDLQLYVFSNKYVDLRTQRVEDRSRPAERAMFYRQVFNWGHGKITDDVVVNREFTKLWKVLMLESASYLERAQLSPNPDSFVSKQKVMQAVEDLQYNLSTHCTGMANVITPMIYAELNFIIKRIFMHPEIIRQVVPQGGTWWRVVETLYVAMKNARPRSTVLYNKAKYGDEILRGIADYSPAAFEQDGPFGSFISLVDAFITTQSILQRGLTENLARHEDDDSREGGGGPDKAAPGPFYQPSAAVPAPVVTPPAPVHADASQDEWSF